ncbi:MAG: RHS repeat domain-containing protein [Clostridia bacterium]
MNRMTAVTSLDGAVTTYSYDAAGRRVETRTEYGAVHTESSSASTLTTTYRYDTVGNLLEQATSGASKIAF